MCGEELLKRTDHTHRASLNHSPTHAYQPHTQTHTHIHTHTHTRTHTHTQAPSPSSLLCPFPNACAQHYAEDTTMLDVSGNARLQPTCLRLLGFLPHLSELVCPAAHASRISQTAREECTPQPPACSDCGRPILTYRHHRCFPSSRCSTSAIWPALATCRHCPTCAACRLLVTASLRSIRSWYGALGRLALVPVETALRPAASVPLTSPFPTQTDIGELCPNLRYLTLLSNPCCPSPHSGYTVEEYRLYRLKIIRVSTRLLHHRRAPFAFIFYFFLVSCGSCR